MIDFTMKKVLTFPSSTDFGFAVAIGLATFDFSIGRACLFFAADFGTDRMVERR